MDNLVIIPQADQQAILDKVYAALEQHHIGCALVASNANVYYLTGRVYSGYVLLTPGHDPIYLVKRPVHLAHPNAIYIRKPEDIPAVLAERGIKLPNDVGIELGALSYNTVVRLSKALSIAEFSDVSRPLAEVRSTKTDYEVDKLRRSGIVQTAVYRQIPSMYRLGMSDVDFQIEIERRLRLEGCLGQFRIAGSEMELFMGNVIAGRNADTPSPYDFAMGGEGIDPSLPIGANGTIIKPGMTVMVDMNGNINGYMTDMTRSYAVGHVSDLAKRAHQLSIDICHALVQAGRAGTEAKAMYEQALDMVRAAALEPYFMGHRQKAGFVGHGIGIEVNELPVIAPRSRDILREGNVIAIEPKFVIPDVGAVGIENTYLVTANGAMEAFTNAAEGLIEIG